MTIIFDADVDAQGGAYATGVLVLMSSAALAVAVTAWRRAHRWVPFVSISIVFVYTSVANIFERPEGIKIASVFILSIVVTSLVSRALRSTQLRVQGVEPNAEAVGFISGAVHGEAIRGLGYQAVNPRLEFAREPGSSAGRAAAGCARREPPPEKAVFRSVARLVLPRIPGFLNSCRCGVPRGGLRLGFGCLASSGNSPAGGHGCGRLQPHTYDGRHTSSSIHPNSITTSDYQGRGRCVARTPAEPFRWRLSRSF